MAVEHGLGLVVVDSADDVDRLEATLPAGATPGRAGPDHPGRRGRHPRQRADRARRVQVRALARARPRAHRADRGVARAADARRARARRLADPRRRAVRRVRRGDRGAGRVPGLRPGGGLGARYTWADRPPTVAAYLDALVGAARAHLPARGGAHHRAGPEHGRGGGDHALPRGDREARARDVRRRRRRDGRQPRGRAVRAALRGRRSSAASTRPATRSTLVGRHCESGDVLVDGVPLAAPAVGDLVVVPATGAYCFTMANNYNGNRRIPVVFASDGRGARWSGARPGTTCWRATSSPTRMGVLAHPGPG